VDRPDQSTPNNQEDLTSFLSRIVADACSRRALVEADTRLRRLSVAECGSGGRSRSAHSADRAGARAGRNTAPG
jgi:hypothetical protein